MHEPRKDDVHGVGASAEIDCRMLRLIFSGRDVVYEGRCKNKLPVLSFELVGRSPSAKGNCKLYYPKDLKTFSCNLI